MEATKPVTLGSSLLVPSVQELVAKENLNTVPDRYVRNDSEQFFNVSDCPSSSLHDRIPIINMENLLLQSVGEAVEPERQKLHLACKDWGFFQLINHGVDVKLVEKVKKEIEEFFSMSMEEKKKYWQQADEIEGFGQAFVVSEEQKLDWGDMFYVVTLPPYMRKPHLFRNLPLPFRFALDHLYFITFLYVFGVEGRLIARTRWSGCTSHSTVQTLRFITSLAFTCL